jgi:hypothetical protein
MTNPRQKPESESPRRRTGVFVPHGQQQLQHHRAFGPVWNDKGCWLGGGVFAALKGCSTLTLYAALKRRSSTVVIADVFLGVECAILNSHAILGTVLSAYFEEARFQ